MKANKDSLVKKPEFRIRQIGLRFLAPLLFGLYPAYYYYTKNASLVKITSLSRVVGVYLLLILTLYLAFLIIYRFKVVRAANATSILLLFFNTYGIVYNLLLDADKFRMEHFSFLPFFIFLSLYTLWITSKIKFSRALSFWRGTTLIISMLLVFTTIKLIPLEYKKASIQRASNQSLPAVPAIESSMADPDIYYLIFDEFAGFQSMREYWGNWEVDEFKSFLEAKGFFVSEEVRSSSLITLHQMANRLNFTDSPLEWEDQGQWQVNLANNRAMALLDAKGYTTIVFEELSNLYPNMPEIAADFVYSSSFDDAVDMGEFFDDYGILVADSTMLKAFSRYYQSDYASHNQRRKFVLSVKARLSELGDYPAPRFVYSHLMLPHPNFVFDRNGNVVDTEFTEDWRYYEDQYIFTMRYITELVTAILDSADPLRPPVIILQSDHGARVKSDNEELPGFPQELRSDILFAMYLPGYNTSTIPPDINPVNTLPIVFNHYLGESIPLEE